MKCSRCQHDEPALRRQRLHEGVRGVLLRESREQPLVVVFEDLHWIDGETQALLDGLVESLPAVPICLLVNYRPEYRHEWGSKMYYTQMRLDALSAATAAELLGALLGPDPTVQPLVPMLIARTDGNPFFLEESVQALEETGVLDGDRGAFRLVRMPEALDIPATAQAILSARIDRLAPEDKRLLQTAAIIGKDVPYLLLEAIAELTGPALHAGLARLQEAEFLYEAQLFPELEHTFKHALTHEVALGTLLGERRHALHGRLVDAIVQIYSGRIDEHLERLARHAFQGERWSEAVDYSGQAGARALGRSAHREASMAYEQALRALEHLPETRKTQEQAIDLRLELRTALLPLGDLRLVGEVLEVARKVASSLGDEHREARVSIFLGVSHYVRAEHQSALHELQRAHGLAVTLGDVGLEAVADNYLGYVHSGRSDFVQGARCLFQSRDLLTGDLVWKRFGQVQLPSVLCRAFLAWILGEMGDFTAALDVGEEGLRLAETAGHPSTLLIITWGVGAAYAHRGDADRAIPLLERSLDICRRVTLPVYFHYIGAALGPAYALRGDVDGAIAILEETVAHDQRVGFMVNHALTLTSLGDAYAIAGRLDDASVQATQALEMARARNEPGHEAYALRLLGEIAARKGAATVVDAIDAFRTAMTLADATSLRPLVAHCHLGLGKLYRRTGKREQAQEHLTTATTMYREMDMRFYLEQAEAEMGA